MSKRLRLARSQTSMTRRRLRSPRYFGSVSFPTLVMSFVSFIARTANMDSHNKKAYRRGTYTRILETNRENKKENPKQTPHGRIESKSLTTRHIQGSSGCVRICTQIRRPVLLFFMLYSFLFFLRVSYYVFCPFFFIRGYFPTPPNFVTNSYM